MAEIVEIQQHDEPATVCVTGATGILFGMKIFIYNWIVLTPYYYYDRIYCGPHDPVVIGRWLQR